MEPIYVVFANKEDKVGNEGINKIVGFMDAYWNENKNPNTKELLNAILIVKGDSTAQAKKVSDYLKK